MKATRPPCEQQQREALRMLAGRPEGATKLAAALHGFGKRCMTKLAAAGYCDRETLAGLHVSRYRITATGLEVAETRRTRKVMATAGTHLTSGTMPRRSAES